MGGANDPHSILACREVRAPDGVPRRVQLSNARGRRHATPVPADQLPLVDFYSAHVAQDARSCVVGCTSPARRGDQIDVIQVSENELPGLELRLYRFQRRLQSQAEECGHQRIALLAALPLLDGVRLPFVVGPQELRLLPVPQAGKRHQVTQLGARQQLMENPGSEDVVKCAHPVHARDGRGTVRVSQRPEEVHEGVSPGSVGEAKVGRRGCAAELLGVLPRQRLAHQPAERVPRRDTSHSPVGLPEGGQL